MITLDTLPAFTLRPDGPDFTPAPDAVVWSGKHHPPAIGEVVDLGKWGQHRIESYFVDEGWLGLICSDTKTGERGSVFGFELDAWQKR